MIRSGNSELGAPARLALFALALIAVGAIAAAIGVASGIGAGAAEPAAMAMGEHTEAGPDESGLATTAGGYSFEPEQTTFTREPSVFRFRILGSDGEAAHDFDLEGGVRLHLIVVRRDFSGYRHLHPALQADGSWLVPISFAEPGAYRAFADFEIGGRKVVLGHDLVVAGAMKPRPLPAATRVVKSGGTEVTLAGGPVQAGEETSLRFTVRRNGVPVDAFEDYVGMRGHLIALHEGDLAYTHLHAREAERQGRIDFDAQLAAPGRYRLFLQFKLGGRVHTAPFTLEVVR